jgi:type IV pilus assembly protein PilC
MAAPVTSNARSLRPDVTFNWEGRDRRGKRIKGKSSAADETLLKADLRRQGIAATRIRRTSASLTFLGSGKVSSQDLAAFLRQLATMLGASIPLVQGLDIIGSNHDKPAAQKLIFRIKADIEAGSSLYEALSHHPQYFDKLTLNLVQAGEKSGALASLLDKIAIYKEKTEALKSKVRKALFYPMFVLAVALVVTLILLIWVIPQFESLYSGSNAALPAFTAFVIRLSRFLKNNGLYLAVVIGVLTWAFFYFKQRSPAMQAALDRALLRVPVVGSILHKSAIARYARTLSTMISAGVPLAEALESVAGATGNIVYERAVLQMRDEVVTGVRLHRAMSDTNRFPGMVVQMIAVGDEAGALAPMSSKVADSYESQVDNDVDALSSLLEPLIMVVLGVLVGGLVIAMYLPFFNLGSVV